MNRTAPMAGRHDDSWINVLTHVVIWASLAGAGLLFAWFVAVLHDATERGDQKRLQQRTMQTFQATVLGDAKVGTIR